MQRLKLHHITSAVKLSVVLALILLVTGTIGHFCRKGVQISRSPALYEAMLVIDGITFQQNGGGPFGHSNYYKWKYAKWRADPKRTALQKFMFWDTGIMYDATNPPDEYPYPPLFKKNG